MIPDQKPEQPQKSSPRRNNRSRLRSDSGLKYLVLLLTNIVVALMWPIFVPLFGALDYVVGYLVGLAFLTLVQPSYSRQNLLVFSFLAYSLWEIVMSSFLLAWTVVQPQERLNRKINSAIVGVPLTVSSDLEIAILATVLTLTPGTMSIELSPNNRVLYVHTINYHDAEEFQKQIKEGFERRLLDITRGTE
jgi:multicomponent Na+:H+ antiporter subunit E